MIFCQTFLQEFVHTVLKYQANIVQPVEFISVNVGSVFLVTLYKCGSTFYAQRKSYQPRIYQCAIRQESFSNPASASENMSLVR